MALKFLLDENVDKAYQYQFLRQSPESVMWVVGDPGAPPRGTLDPEILIWCEEHDFILVTNNRKSMPVHLNDHIAIGRHVPGILLLNVDFSIGRNLEELFLIAEYAFEDEYQDRIVHLPLPENLE
ncbi:hypothetical protein C7Y66_15430 [Chroococcidiopsis sp. CCALA 051]|uniref:DUF5615 family PIN-like protein n=1 Tax=Chroococcidiopsis sp. CCALA 051 TaxID=869949 RepID=UPI000D0D59D5|nr:DUF5615 family PIN-like protein [Chroococcidiopsis sp. CCALA 051]MBE9018928.1 DUF5615 family PIN-like protein [Chroococcidiopsidales cyanobacterium LEGE 13417]PSM48268.1 hypothetical protein C7Y66_15430 [Chroococcidiopsis sp. CCALA 051]